MASNDPAQTATQQDALPLRQLALLGTITGPAGEEALLRGADGRIHRARPGDRIEGVQIIAIDNGSVAIVARGQSYRLDLPS